MEPIEIKELDLNMIHPNVRDIESQKKSTGFTLTVIGKRKTGKSWLIRSILYHKRHLIPCGTVFSGTEDSNHFYSSIIPSTFIHPKLDMDKLRNFVKRQKISIKYLQNPWSLLILDDCMDDPKLFNDPLIQGLYKNGRHWNILFILALQYSGDIRPVIRTNIDGTFILREPNLKNRRRIYENYAGVIPDFKIFCTLMDQLTNDFMAMYIHNSTNSNDWKDCVFWYKAKETENFRFGSPDFWKFHNTRFNEGYEDVFEI